MPDSPKTQSPPAGKIGRLTSEAKGLVDDTREWVDAKLRLFEMDLEEKVDGVVNRFVSGAAVVFMVALALIFVLVAGALALGSWWGSDPLGFLAVSGVALLGGVLIHYLRPRFVKGSMGVADRVREKAELPAATDTPQLPAATQRNGAEHG